MTQERNPAQLGSHAQSARIADLDAALQRSFPREWAEEWDRVGILAGDRQRALEGVLVTLDPTATSIRRASDLGANVLLTHHPAALTPQERLAPGRGPAGLLFQALDSGVALIAEHTNLDRSPAGSAALPALLDLQPVAPIEQAAQPMTRLTVYAPAQSAAAIVDAMSAAGAGRIGDYDGCTFTSEGTGQFVPGAAANPAVGAVGQRTQVSEIRIEMVAPASDGARVIAAARAAHPYEEPLIVSENVSIARGRARMGMLCTPRTVGEPQPLTLAALARDAGARMRVTPRVWGDADRRVERIVTATGSSTSLLGAVFAAGADVLVCGEVRYHDALDAAQWGLAIVELGHDVSEWPLVGVLARAALQTPGLPSERVFVDEPAAAWWTP